MITSERLISLVAMLGLTWQECSQDPAVFCYRIGMDLLAPLRRQQSAGDQSPSCSTPSNNSSAPSMTSKD